MCLSEKCNAMNDLFKSDTLNMARVRPVGTVLVHAYLFTY